MMLRKESDINAPYTNNPDMKEPGTNELDINGTNMDLTNMSSSTDVSDIDNLICEEVLPEESNELEIQKSVNRDSIFYIVELNRDDTSDLINEFNLLTEPICSYSPTDIKTMIETEERTHRENETLAYLCCICHRSFVSRKGFKEHMVIKHTDPDKQIKYPCHVCGATFPIQRYLNRHCKSEHGVDSDQKCEVCQRTFNGKSAFKRHTCARSKLKLPCHICSERLKNEESYKEHMNVVHQTDKLLTCSFCDRQYPTAHRLVIHVKQVHTVNVKYDVDELASEDGQHSCSVCSLKFTHKPDMEKHSLIRHGARYICSICGKKCNDTRGYSQHLMVMHSVDKPEVCDLCGKRYSIPKQLQQHIQYTHRVITKNHACEICERKFETPNALKSHMAIHSEPQIICSNCGKAFRRMSGLKHHRCINGANFRKQHKCKICGKALAGPELLRIHTIQKHSTERSHECKYCNKGFASEGGKKAHEALMHEGKQKTKSKLKRCKVCGKSIIQMTTHMKIHSGEKNFTCEICSKQFRAIHHLDNHMATTHSEVRPFPCPICDMRFKMAHHMRAHVDRKHPQTHESSDTEEYEYD